MTISPRNTQRINMRMVVIIGVSVISLTLLTVFLVFLFNIGDVRDVKGKAVITTIATGNWSNTSIWSTGVIPTVSDNVILENGYDVEVDGHVSCASVTITAPSFNGKTDLTINSGFSLTVTGDVVMNGGNSNKRKANLYFKDSSAMTIEGDLTVNSTSTSRAQINMTKVNCILNLANSFNQNSGVRLRNSATSVINFNGTTAQVFPASYGLKFSNVHFNNTSTSGIKLDAAITNNIISENLRVQSGIFNNDGFEISGRLGRTFEVANGVKFILIGSSSFPTGFNAALDTASTVCYEGLTAQTIDNQDYGHLEIRNTGNKTFTTVQSIGIAGNFISESSNYITANSTVVFNGNNPQYILGNIPFSFFDLTVDDSSGVILNNPVTVDNNLTLINGKITTTTTNIISFNLNATSNGGARTSFINGPAIKNTNATTLFTFPLGKGTYYRPLGIEPTSNGISTFTVEYFDNSYTNTNSLGPNLDHVSKIEYFTIDRQGTANAIVSLSWDGNSAVNNSFLADLCVSRWNGVKWTNMGNAGFTGDILSGTVTSNAVTSFSPFTIGSRTGNNPLPITLRSFTAEPKADEVLVNWETVSEVNNDFFTVERTTNGIDFEEVATVDGAGNSNFPLEYQISDDDPLPDLSYYRLKQTDYDGQFEYFKMVPVQFEQNNLLQEVTISPNPFSSDLTIKYTSGNNAPVSLVIMNIRAQVIHEEVIPTSVGINRFRFEHGNDLENGIYFINLIQGNYTTSYKVIKI